MLVRLTSSLQTKNKLGLSDQDLKESTMDPYFNYLRLGQGYEIESEKAGTVITLIGRELNVDRDHMAIVQPHPALHELGTVSFNPVLGGKITPTFVLKTYRKFEPIELEYLYEIRLLK